MTDYILVHYGSVSTMSTPMERLRQIVGSKGWDYCVLWKLSEDQRFLEFMDCCCSGSEGSNENGTIGEELVFSCRDGMYPHPRTTTCEMLSQFPSSHPLDGINMEILISNQPRWLNLSNVSDSNVNEDSLGTKVLIPIPGGLAELYAARQVSEDVNVIDYVMAQCNIMVEQSQISNSSNAGPSFSIDMNMIHELQSNSNSINNNESLAPLTPSMNFLQQFSYISENKPRDDFLEGGNASFQADQNGFDALIQHNANNLTGVQEDEKSSLTKQEVGRADSVSDSDLMDDDDDPKYSRRRVTKGPQSKNLVAERKRRKKLNERLYNLRSLVPNISKLDRASILGDAITYVQELKKEEKDLQDELARNSDDEGTDHSLMSDVHHHHQHLHHKSFSAEVSNLNGTSFRPDYDHEKPINGFHMGTPENLKSNYELGSANDKAQQMEVQVEVGQLEANDFYVKVFGEQKRGGLVRLMEALNCLGLEITNVNMTSCISLVSYVFIVKKRDCENVHAEYLRDSLLEATRNGQAGFWSEMAKASENRNGIDHQHQHLLHSHNIGSFHNHFHHLGIE